MHNVYTIKSAKGYKMAVCASEKYKNAAMRSALVGSAAGTSYWFISLPSASSNAFPAMYLPEGSCAYTSANAALIILETS